MRTLTEGRAVGFPLYLGPVLGAGSFRLRGFDRPLRRPDDEREDGADHQHPRDDVEGERVAIGGVEDVGEQECSQHASETPDVIGCGSWRGPW